MAKGEVLAAGGVIWRPTGVAAQRVEVVVVHRPRYDDWSLPKGKADPGETAPQTALREVLEETGYRCELAEELTSVRYVDHKGRPKLVRYWTMTVAGGAFAANDEVDELRWCDPAEARALLSYERDRSVLDTFVARHP